jgi:hypothetical protein
MAAAPSGWDTGDDERRNKREMPDATSAADRFMSNVALRAMFAASAGMCTRKSAKKLSSRRRSGSICDALVADPLATAAWW